MASSAANGGSGDGNIKRSTSGKTAAMTSTTAAPTREGKSYFELQREALLSDIAMSFEHVLANINKLNRSLEAVITVGHEFSSVEALWSQFEGVMAHEQGDDDDGRSEGRSSRGTGDAERVADGDGETETESEANTTTTEGDEGDDTVVQR